MRPRSLFRDRRDAGQSLAEHLRGYRDASPVVLGLPRGGVPVAYEVAHELEAPLDVCVVRKIRAPVQPELGIGAVAEEEAFFVDRHAMAVVGVSSAELEELVARERNEVAVRVRRYRHGAPPVPVRGKTVLVIDDGLATGGTARAAVQTLRTRGAGHIVLAVPVGAAARVEALALVPDELVCPHPEDDFFAVSEWYEDFSTTTDEEVVQLLDRARAELQAYAGTGRRHSERVRVPVIRNVRMPVGDRLLEGHLTIPPRPRGLVLFAHGRGSGRMSPRNRYVATELQAVGLATLLFDLLRPEEEVVDAFLSHGGSGVDVLTSRLVGVTDWGRQQAETRALSIGYFGASTGAAAALLAAGSRPDVIQAIVSSGGQLALGETDLERVKAPTLLVVGSADPESFALNQAVFARLYCEKRLEVIPGASHIFEEPGALETAAGLAATWFTDHLDPAKHETRTG
jgi:putative phosphoribosyl transferase